MKRTKKRPGMSQVQIELTVDDGPAIDVHDLPADVRRVVTRQIHVRRREFAGCPGRFISAESPNDSTLSAGKVDGMSGVQIGPGATPLTRIFFEAKLFAKARVNDVMAPFVDSNQSIGRSLDKP